MRYLRAVLVALALVSSLVLTRAHAQEVPATFENACQTTSAGGIYRWAAKTDPTLPEDPSQVQPTTVGTMIGWTPLPGNWRDRAHVTSPRQPGQEQQFFELVAAVQRVGLDPDGDVHLEVADEDDPTIPRVIVEIPQGDDDSPFYAARQALFGAMGVDPTGIRTGTTAAIWTRTSSNRRQRLEPLSVDVVGQGFYDGEHCDAQGVGQTHGTPLANATCWELHPIVQLTVVSPAAESLVSDK